MKSITKRRAGRVVGPLLAVASLAAGSVAMASPAFAVTFIGQNQPTVVQAVQGQTTTLNWTYKNTGGAGNVPASGATITFNAPAGTTFPAQSTVPWYYSDDGTTFSQVQAPWALNGCTVGGGGTTLSCNAVDTAGNWSWTSGRIERFTPQVNVSPTAAPGTQSAAASMQYTDPASGTNYTINNGTLDVNVVSKMESEAPAVNPANTIAPTQTGDVGATVENAWGTPATGNVTVYLTAPANSTFTSNQVWGTDIIQGVPSAGSSPRFTNCTLSNGNKNMTCNGNITIPAAGNGQRSAVKFTTPVAVDPSAAQNTLYSNGDFNMTNSPGNNNTIKGGRTNLQYKTPVIAAVPMINEQVGAAAAGIIGAAGLAAGGTFLYRRRNRNQTA
ncbi:hypothetical protein GCM10023063_37010 [Arthrobacter methylotrophus]|uniref:Uncharacterized protein n=1 Tax=Arthrobacter methylotrophus TaxID=121291 RepID=A0ABV5UJK2_9MICC